MAIFLPENKQISVKASTDMFQVNRKNLYSKLGLAQWRTCRYGYRYAPEAWAYYLPMKTADTVNGVVGFHFDNPEQILTPENKVVLDTIARLGALAIERIGGKE